MSSHGHSCPSPPKPTFPPPNSSFIPYYTPNPGYIGNELLSIAVSSLNHVSPRPAGMEDCTALILSGISSSGKFLNTSQRRYYRGPSNYLRVRFLNKNEYSPRKYYRMYNPLVNGQTVMTSTCCPFRDPSSKLDKLRI
ncbi:hypothetical protein CY34DRAFT_134721 [Suillus luteus UH-Slu-Lm8-n1]|uniref:Uncharacterized protein n=1 Tax=Suillus luteus UH-Slu-Lm8-n1 TaxID=930992 RepID=A0A0D0ALB1_9AGAM|nr:hypothetical protein CY34DRAFT_134721 [Suillus luteus UH-Slu-Lm8-n1]